jgi:predicted  nucleic acid-binding Zn-ribbon protein
MTTPVTDYSTQIDSISTDFSTSLDNFTKSFVEYYKNLDSTTSQNNYDVAKNSLSDEITKMYQLKASIMNSMSDVNTSMNDLEKTIGTDESKLKEMTQNYQQQTGDSSNMLANDAKEKYKIQYVANITMFLGIVGMITLFYSFMKNKSQ